jgi:hypothetical protein
MTAIIVWLFGAALTAWLAAQKNRNVGGWLILGLLFSFLAMLFIAMLPPIEKGKEA